MKTLRRVWNADRPERTGRLEGILEKFKACIMFALFFAIYILERRFSFFEVEQEGKREL
ncbi:hypothetical protein RND71_023636 [Anisodus tanguticus]|uniref:Uncharacterized protein n=1 Tax=Anisodus tanguticus TaxID=243964 RepID=A0AAE1RW06_9SOLA|nr:hypothetical protein RND71_023636 [Anisodus tanguticus]